VHLCSFSLFFRVHVRVQVPVVPQRFSATQINVGRPIRANRRTRDSGKSFSPSGNAWRSCRRPTAGLCAVQLAVERSNSSEKERAPPRCSSFVFVLLLHPGGCASSRRLALGMKAFPSEVYRPPPSALSCSVSCFVGWWPRSAPPDSLGRGPRVKHFSSSSSSLLEEERGGTSSRRLALGMKHKGRERNATRTHRGMGE